MAMDQLPEDLLADVLRRLPPHVLAAAQCVHSSWRATIDARCLMDLARLLLAGIFINFRDHVFRELFARPSSSPTASAKLHRYLPDDHRQTAVQDHCNDLLLLLDGYVVNPAMRQWAVLPPRPPCCYEEQRFFRQYYYIAFDPAMFPHYEVPVVPEAPYKKRLLYRRVAGMEWPPSPMVLHVYSSRTNKWEEKSYLRHGEAFRTVADVPWSDDQRCAAVYWHGHLYVQHHFVMRISLLSGKYRVIKPAQGINTSQFPQLRLAKSEKGVYLASTVSHRWLQVWILDESRANLEWVLKYLADISHILAHRSYNTEVHGSWVIEDVNYHDTHDRFPDYKEKASSENKFEWDSDNEDVLGTKDKVDGQYIKDIYILGFHPHKEVIYLSESLKRGLSYHLDTLKLQDLGNMYPTRYDWFAEDHKFIKSSFPYTPCWTVEFPANN